MTIERFKDDPIGDVTPLREETTFRVEDMPGLVFSPCSDSIHRFANPYYDHIKYFDHERRAFAMIRMEVGAMRFLAQVANLPETIRHDITSEELDCIASLDSLSLEEELNDLS